MKTEYDSSDGSGCGEPLETEEEGGRDDDELLRAIVAFCDGSACSHTRCK
jgi:hypothetical protein